MDSTEVVEDQAPPQDWVNWKEWLETRPRLGTFTKGELNDMLKDAPAPTEDDVPFKFPVKVPVKPSHTG